MPLIRCTNVFYKGDYPVTNANELSVSLLFTSTDVPNLFNRFRGAGFGIITSRCFLIYTLSLNALLLCVLHSTGMARKEPKKE